MSNYKYSSTAFEGYRLRLIVRVDTIYNTKLKLPIYTDCPESTSAEMDLRLIITKNIDTLTIQESFTADHDQLEKTLIDQWLNDFNTETTEKNDE